MYPDNYVTEGSSKVEWYLEKIIQVVITTGMRDKLGQAWNTVFW